MLKAKGKPSDADGKQRQCYVVYPFSSWYQHSFRECQWYRSMFVSRERTPGIVTMCATEVPLKPGQLKHVASGDVLKSTKIYSLTGNGTPISWSSSPFV
jgi:hypothetical protein